MANEKQKSTPAPPEKLQVKVITNYGGHKPGAWIEISASEYARFRLLESQGRHRVVISKADLEAEAAAAEEALRMKAEADRAAHRSSPDHEKAWQLYRQRSQTVVDADRLQAQKEVLESMTPTQKLTDAEAQAQYRERIAAVRTG